MNGVGSFLSPEESIRDSSPNPPRPKRALSNDEHQVRGAGHSELNPLRRKESRLASVAGAVPRGRSIRALQGQIRGRPWGRNLPDPWMGFGCQ
jgi:hypothetical protein